MSRSGYNDCDGWELIKWRGMVASAIRGKRGQQFLKDLLAALDAMPVKELIADELEQDGAVCAMGALARARGVDYEQDRSRRSSASGRSVQYRRVLGSGSSFRER